MVFWANEHLTIILPLLIAICLEPCLYSMLHSSRTKETIWLYWVLCIEFCQKHPERKYKARRISGPLLNSAYEASAAWVQNSWRRQRWICRGSVGLGCIWMYTFHPRSWNVFTTYKSRKGAILSIWETTWSNAAKMSRGMVWSRCIMNYAVHTHG